MAAMTLRVPRDRTSIRGPAGAAHRSRGAVSLSPRADDDARAPPDGAVDGRLVGGVPGDRVQLPRHRIQPLGVPRERRHLMTPRQQLTDGGTSRAAGCPHDQYLHLCAPSIRAPEASMLWTRPRYPADIGRAMIMCRLFMLIHPRSWDDCSP